MKRLSPLVPLIIVVLLATAAWYVSTRPGPPPTLIERPAPDTNPATSTLPTATPPKEPKAKSPPRPPLSDLAALPDWSSLDAWQFQISRQEFVDQMEQVFTVSDAWRKWFHLGENEVLIETGIPGKRFRLRFATTGPRLPNPRYWRGADQLPAATPDLPLQDLRIAIDPGHIGGDWAIMEERWFQIGQATPVKEGDMTLLVAQLLKPRLEALGAEVILVREDTEPVTDLRPKDLGDFTPGATSISISKQAERLFYRTAEIRARADRVNQEIQPDFVICLHFNADGWGDPTKPTLTDRSHFHLLLNGAYMDSEIALADQRFNLSQKIFQQTHPEEAGLALAIAHAFAETTDLRPYLYEANSSRAVNIGGNPYLWARNLLANRLYECPVVFLEPYVMNSKADYPRIQAGDYEGIRDVAGKPRPSIFREYADTVADGIADHFRALR